MPMMRFVGGPLDGQHRQSATTPDDFTVLHEGTDFVYRRRRLVPGADGEPLHAVYAPPAMPETELDVALKQYPAPGERG